MGRREGGRELMGEIPGEATEGGVGKRYRNILKQRVKILSEPPSEGFNSAAHHSIEPWREGGSRLPGIPEGPFKHRPS